MSLRIQNFITLLCLSGMILIHTGCYPLIIGAAAGAGGMAYAKGNIKTNFDKPLEKTHKAVVEGLKDSGVFITEDSLGVAESRVVGEFEDGEDVVVHLKPLTKNTTKVFLRVGLIGNEDRSMALMDAIKKNANKLFF